MSSARSDESLAKSTRARIVVADDDPDLRELVSELLREEGYEVDEVSNGSELLVRVESSFVAPRNVPQTDLFITDIHMPGYTGTQVLDGLREAGLQTPVIVMTAADIDQAREQSQALGAWFLGKPFTREQMLALVTRALSQTASAKPAS